MASTSPATTDAKSEFLKLFWTLAESDVTTRTLAAAQLINYLQSSPSSTNDATSDDDAVQYTLKRLVRGLASSRDAARQGFSAALASLLAAFPQQLPLTNALDLVAKAMATSAAMKPMEQREHMFGKLFGLLAIHRSGRLAGDDDTTVAVLQHLADMASWKHWLREACFEALLAVLASDVSPSLFTSRVASIFAPLLLASGDGAVLNADQVALALGVHQYVTTHSIAQNKLPADFPATNLVRRKHLHALVEPLKHSTRCFPRVHGAWLALFGSVRTAHGDKLDAELFQEAWTVLVENVLLAPATATHERKGLALKLFETVVLGMDLPSSVLRATLTPNLVKCLYNNTLAKKTYLHDAAKHTLHAFAVQQPAEFFHFMQREFTTPMPALVDGNDDEDNDNTELQAAVKSGGFDAIIAIEEERERLAARARKFAAVRLWAIEHMTSALVEKLTQQPTEATKDTESALRFLTVHALFTVGGSTTSAPAKTKAKSKKTNKDVDAVETLVAPSPALSPAVRQALVKKLFSLVSVQLSSAEHETPLALVFAIATQQLDANTFPLRTPLEEGDELVANARRHVAALRKKRGEPQPTDDAFALLFMSGVLQLLAGEDQQHSLADLEQCFAALQAKPKAAKATKKTSKKAKAEEPEEPEVDAVVVLTDLLLGLLSQDSSAMREIVAHVFRALVPLMTTASLQTLVAAVAPATAEPEDETNGKPREGDEEEDDEEEGDEDMEEAEEEEEEDIVLTSASDIADALRDDANLAELHREDQTLSAIVGQVKDKARAKKDAKKFRLGVLHFKLRVVDLLATYATATFKSSASSASVVPLVLPLFESLAAIAGSDVEQRVLKERLQSVLLHKFLKGLAGAQDDAVAPRTREDRQLTVSALEKVVEVLSTKALDKELASKVGTAVVVQLVRVSLAGSDVDNEVLQAVRELFRRTSVEVFTRKHAKFPRATFDELVTKHATLAARLLLAPLAAIAEASSSSASSSTDVKPAVDEFSKTEVFRLLAGLVKSKHVSESEDVHALFTQHRGHVLHALEAVLRQPSAKATADNDDGEDKAKGQAKNELKAKRLKVVLSCALQLVRTWRDVEAPVSELASLVSVLEALETNSPVVKSMAKQVVQAVSGSEDEAAETQEKKTATKRKPVESKAKASPSKKAKTTTTTTTKATKQTKPTKRKRSNSTADDHA